MPTEIHVLGLTTLPAMGPARLAGLLAQQTPDSCWEQLVVGERRVELAVAAGVVAAVVDAWVAAARDTDLEWLRAAYETHQVTISALGSSGYPAALSDDPEPPMLLFSSGDLSLLNSGPPVGIIGTRSCTRYGIEVARDLGLQLALAGVSVVSGLAIGIDAAAHAGATSVDGAGPIGVVGSGLDVIYPRANTGLWKRVQEDGLLCSEAPLGARPERWRFPARNRIIAALADIVVVVESHGVGGSLTTVDEALTRDVPVMAVPGSILSPASTGTNRLIADGCIPLCCCSDLFEALGMSQRPDGPTVAQPPAEHAQLLDAFAGQPVTFATLCERLDIAPGALALALEALDASGWVARRGLFYERCEPPSTPTGAQGPRS